MFIVDNLKSLENTDWAWADWMKSACHSSWEIINRLEEETGNDSRNMGVITDRQMSNTYTKHAEER